MKKTEQVWVVIGDVKKFKYSRPLFAFKNKKEAEAFLQTCVKGIVFGDTFNAYWIDKISIY